MKTVTPPDGLEPEVWLVKYDASPRLFPDWPLSKKLAVVAVKAADGMPSEALWLETPADANETATRSGMVQVLYFTVPASLLTAERCSS